MTQKTIKKFRNEIYSKPPENNYATKQADVYHIDEIWILDISDLKDYGPENNRIDRYVLVIIDNFSKFVWTTPLENKNPQTKKDSFENILISSKSKRNLIETDRGKKFYKKTFQAFPKKTISKIIRKILL